MKQFILTLVVTVMSVVAALADEPQDIAAIEARYRAVFADLMTKTNQRDFAAASASNRFLRLAAYPALRSFRLEADAALAGKGFTLGWIYTKSWPRLSANAIEKGGFRTRFARRLALAEKYDTDAHTGAFYSAGATLDEMVPVLSETVCNYDVMSISGIKECKRMFQKAAQRGLKRALRTKGISFVTKNGENPCEAWMTRLTTALNAPRLAGLNEWLADLGYKARADLSSLPSEAEIAKLKDSIMFGDVAMRERYQVLLSVCLGVDGYNAFVKEYNGD